MTILKRSMSAYTCIVMWHLAVFNHVIAQNPSCSGGWDYGYHGPATWATFCKTCGGQRQSPIDLSNTTATHNESLPIIRFMAYDKYITNLTVKDNGHTAFISIPTSDTFKPYVMVPTKRGVKYYLLQIHFHWGFYQTGSEHSSEGNKFPLEIHLVHQTSDASAIAVLGVFGKISCTEQTPLLQSIADLLVTVMHAEETSLLRGSFAVKDFLPGNTDSFYTYSGSLTTPPCSEIVEWYVFGDPVNVHINTINELEMLRDDAGDLIALNYRPTQPLYGRVVQYRGTFPTFTFDEVGC